MVRLSSGKVWWERGVMVHDAFNLLKSHEVETYNKILWVYGHLPENFRIKVEEDQSGMDMNDLNYKIIITVETTYLPTKKMQTYRCPQGSSLWLENFENDLKSGHFAP